MSATPTVFFIDDSATMREVIKIAFRRENINVVAYSDAASALGQIENAPPDVVITDVIMPDKDGYEVCQFIKQHPSLNKTPVILMSGVVNRAVAEKAFAVKADELIRKPFQPQDLITRVRHLLNPAPPVPLVAPTVAANPALPNNAAAALSSIFQAQAKPAAASAFPGAAFAQAAAHTSAPRPQAPAPAPQFAQPAAAPVQLAPAFPAVAAAPRQVAPPPSALAPVSGTPLTDIQKLRMEMMRLEGLVKKLQSELLAEREYTKSLEEHLKTMQHH